MKKSLFALAALGAFAGAAQAQSSVTLYGTLDASMSYINNAGVDPASTNTSIANGTSTPSTASCSLCYTDGQIATSVWGMRGVEDLGGGLRATFDLQGDLSTNNGATNSTGMFRRGANVGLGGSFGTVFLGLRGNPLVAANASLMPVGGNTVNQNRNVIGMATGDFINNGIQYQSPNISGLVATLAYGASNQVGDMSGGSVYAGALSYTAGNLSLVAAYNHKEEAANTGFVNTGLAAGPSTETNGASTVPTGTGLYASSANATLNKNTGYLAGIKYKFGNFTVGYGFTHGEFTTYASQSSTAAGTVSRTAGANASMFGIGYQATPAILLGLNYTVNTADASSLNGQLRYALSKRTTSYIQATYNMNGSGASSSGSAFGNYGVQQNTNVTTGASYATDGKMTTTSTGSNINGGATPAGSSYAGGMPNTNVTVINVGVIHNF
jgi:predicted porin